MIELCLVLFQVMAAHAWWSPYTKVEESFNVQAVHDFLHSPVNVIFNQSEIARKFDHVEFPGVVPRTFWGALAVATFTRPITAMIPVMRDELFVARMVLASFVVLACHRLASVASAKYSSNIARWFILLICVQFHFPFYSSRMLPNTFAMVLITLSQAELLCDTRKQDYRAIALQIFCVVVFRCDMILLLAPTALYVWFQTCFRSSKTNVTVYNVFVQGLWLFAFGFCCFAASLACTVALDTEMWLGRHYWPEGSVLYYNTVLNKSSNWGTSPWYWYFIVGLPKALLASYPLVLLGATTATGDHVMLLAILLPTAVFVCLYSILPHKEIRFMFPVIPALTLGAAFGADWICKRQGWLLRVALLLAMFASAIAAIFFSHVSTHNYPAGYALDWLRVNHHDQASNVHIDAYSAMNGISRFVQSMFADNVVFSKQEGEIANWRQFDFLISSTEEKQRQGFVLVHTELGEPRVDFKHFPAIIKLQPSVFVWRKENGNG